jgi:hypothetical protein
MKEYDTISYQLNNSRELMSENRIQEIINSYELERHPEGGFYKRFYESTTKINYPDHKNRPLMTSIHYLLTGGNYSHFHRLDADEMWNYYEGNTNLIIHVFYTSNNYEKIILGSSVKSYQFCVPAGCWFAAELESKNKNNYALSGCTVSPGFLFDTFELGKKSELIKKYPDHEFLIAKMALEY